MPSHGVILSASKALQALGHDMRVSPIYSSAAWPDQTQPAYSNAVLQLCSARPPEALLEGLLAIEAAYGRVRFADPAQRYAPRTLDLDLLAVGGEIRNTPRLTLPHPAMVDRDFVLMPLRDLCCDWLHPRSGEDVSTLLARLPKVSAVSL